MPFCSWCLSVASVLPLPNLPISKRFEPGAAIARAGCRSCATSRAATACPTTCRTCSPPARILSSRWMSGRQAHLYRGLAEPGGQSRSATGIDLAGLSIPCAFILGRVAALYAMCQFRTEAAAIEFREAGQRLRPISDRSGGLARTLRPLLQGQSGQADGRATGATWRRTVSTITSPRPRRP